MFWAILRLHPLVPINPEGRIMSRKNRKGRKSPKTSLPELGAGDPGPASAARGPVERAILNGAAVARRKVTGALAKLPPGEHAVAVALLDLVERIGSVRAVLSDGPRGTGVSDGGAVARYADMHKLRAAFAAIADAGPGKTGLARIEPERLAKAVKPEHMPVDRLGLVYWICIRGRPLGDLLAAHGYSKRSDYTRDRAVDELAAALRDAGRQIVC